MTYVDDMEAPFEGMVMCHMVSDNDAELLAMADTIGVARKWHQHPGTARSHFDISKSKRALAIKAGAREITWRQAGMIARMRRQALASQPVVPSIAEMLQLPAGDVADAPASAPPPRQTALF